MANHQQSSTPTINMINPLYLIVSVIWCFYLLPSSSIACSCFYAHPQEHFCSSDFVVSLTIQDYPKLLVNGQSNGQSKGQIGYLRYPVKVIKVFKGTTVRKGFIYTGPELSSCSPTFIKNTTYLLTGRVVNGKPLISSCNFIAKWAHLTIRQKKGFRRNYARACGCKVVDSESYSFYGHHERDSDNSETNRRRSGNCHWQTKWELEFDCQGDHSICTPVSKIPDLKADSNRMNQIPGINDVIDPFNTNRPRNRSKLGQKCQWDPNPDYMDCLKRRQLNRQSSLV